MREVFIISTGQIVNGRTAGSQRMMNIARAVANGGVAVFLCSYNQISNNSIVNNEIYPGIYNLESKNSNGRREPTISGFLKSLNGFMKGRDAEKAIYLYPTAFTLKDWTYLFYFKFIRRYKLFCDINELRSTNVFTATPPGRLVPLIIFILKSVRDFVAYKISEIQVLFYDGIIVISSGLQKYYSRFAGKIIKVPILCDAEKIPAEQPVSRYDGRVFKICFAGFINCRKEGFEILFKALSRINCNSRRVELYLYGILTEEDKHRLGQLAGVYELNERLFYMGNIDPDDLITEFALYHLLILPRPLTRQTKFGFSTKLSEYLISGIPVLVTDVSDNSAYIKDNYNGFVIPPGSEILMENKILEIMENYNENARRIAGNAFLTVREYFDYKLYTKPLTDLFFNN